MVTPNTIVYYLVQETGLEIVFQNLLRIKCVLSLHYISGFSVVCNGRVQVPVNETTLTIFQFTKRRKRNILNYNLITMKKLLEIKINRNMVGNKTKTMIISVEMKKRRQVH